MEHTDHQLLEQYQRTRDDAPLQVLISRYLNQVYSSAVRQVRDPHLAEDVTQAVFILFSQRAAGFSPSVIIPGWLFRTTRYVSLHAMKKQSTRQRHEQQAARPERVEAEGASTWNELAPSIDAALAQLKGRYRDALVLRFFQSMSLAQVGQAMGVSEEAARKLVDRGLDKLRGQLASTGVACTSAGLAAALSQQVIDAAPAHLTQWASQFSAASATAAGTSTLALTKGAFTIMSTAKAKVAAAIVAVAVLGGGAVVVNSVAQAPSVTTQPVVHALAAAGTAERMKQVRKAAVDVCGAAAECDVDTVKSLSIVESPQYQELSDAMRQVMLDAKDLRALMKEKFGTIPEEMGNNLPGGPEVFRKQYLPTAPVRYQGDVAMIDIGTQSRPPVLVFREDAGRWKLLMGASFCGGKPEKANETTAGIMRLSEGIRALTEAIRSGQIPTAQIAAQEFAAHAQQVNGQ